MSIRFKLTTTAVAVILVANSLFSFITLEYLSGAWMGEVQNRVGRNLSSARAAYRNHLSILSTLLQATARDRTLVAAVQRGDRAELAAALRALSPGGEPPVAPPTAPGNGADGGTCSALPVKTMDFALLLDAAGRVVCRSGSPTHGDELSADPLVQGVLRQQRAACGTVVLSQQRLEAEGAPLARRAAISLVPTEAAQPTAERMSLAGMVAAVAVPVFDAAGTLQAVLYGGDLLNRSYEMVDAIRQQVFRDESYNGQPIGTVTIFLGDVRISTNVLTDDGVRAVGTRLSLPVRRRVLEQGSTWSQAAFVVNDWYFTAYEPIRDPDQQVIGALYVGLLQTPFVHQRNVIIAVFLAFMIGTTLAVLVLLVLVTESAIRPINRVVRMAQRVIGGDLSARIGIRPAGEMGVLCRAIDSMAHSIEEREDLLQQATRQQIGRSEQLASVGRLAAGVAHEVNNPLTGVLAFADLLRDKENLDSQDREDVELIIRETKRAREIVRGLLDFARETPSRKAPLAVNNLLRQTLQLLGKREAFQNIYLVDDLAADLPLIQGDKNQLQQVFVNLSLNACEAMPDGGTLMITSALADEAVVIQITDTGMGIKREHLDKIFEPFFTTKPVGKGTGLGLAVSYGIIQQHGGTVEVQSEERKGTTFVIRLPLEGAGEA